MPKILKIRDLIGALFGVILFSIAVMAFEERSTRPIVHIQDFHDALEAEQIIAAAQSVPPERRITFVSGYFLGRKYHPETQKRIKDLRSNPNVRLEASNTQPLPLEILPTSLEYLDCMTYVEHVLALASSDRADYTGSFLPRLVDVMFDANSEPLTNHLRSHFTSHWGDVNERKGYILNLARGHPAAVSREVLLNKVGDNKTYYVVDRFMISTAPQIIYYFPLNAILERRVDLSSGDILALITDKEGLDVSHMAFFILQHGKRLFRHASYSKNIITEEDFETFLRQKKDLKGLMVFRPILKAPPPPNYQFVENSHLK
ncbi:MAG: DUF1460 domain-containing protein [Candidatus Riflebacteria bacterium]|nr:DUF1460 domain-containing protein [Candidatus Riflebacteria bacterium]